MANIFKAKTLVARTGNFSNEIIAPNLVYNTGNQIINDIKTFTSRPTVNGTGVLLSGEAASLPNTIVYTTGNQIIFGNKTFINNLEIEGTGIFNSIDLSNISEFLFSGTEIRLLDSPVYISGGLYISGVGVTPALYISNIASTGLTLDRKINSLSGYINSSDSNIVFATGPQTIQGSKSFIANTFFQNDITVTGNIRGSGTAYFNDNVNIVNNLNVNGTINNSTVVTTKNNQTITGIKTFVDKMSLNAFSTSPYNSTNTNYRLSIGGNTDENIGIQIDGYGANGQPQILMRSARGTPTNLSGVLKGDVLFNLQARGYISGLNAYSQNNRVAVRGIADENWVSGQIYTGQGTYLVFRTTNIGSAVGIDKVAISTSGLNVLDGNIYVSGQPVLTGVNLSDLQTQINTLAANLFTTGSTLTTNLASTGNSLQTQVNTLTSNLFTTGSTLTTNLASTGNSLQTQVNTLVTNVYITGLTLNNKIDSLSGVSVLTSGNQIIYGNKTFVNNIQVQSTGIFDSVDLSNISEFQFSGTNINLIDGNVYISGGNIYISGNPVSTGVNLSGLQTQINTLTTNLFTTGANLNNKINALSGISVLTFGNQTIGGDLNVTGTYKINNVPYNLFQINFLSSSANLSAGHNYICVVGGGYSATLNDRTYPIMEKCIARKGSISLLNGGPGNNINGFTGYFINTSTNPPQTGIISTGINATVGSVQYTYTGFFSNPINISPGDLVTCSLLSSGTVNNVRTFASIYCNN